MRFWATVTFVALGLAGCAAIDLEPAPPPLVVVGNLGPDAAELVVVVPSGKLGYKWAWAVLVDGQARAWLPRDALKAAAGYTRIPVAPGQHDVTVSHRTLMLFAPIIVPIIPVFSEDHASATVNCQARARCGIVVEKHIKYFDDGLEGMTLTASEAGPEQLAEAIKGLTEHPPVP